MSSFPYFLLLSLLLCRECRNIQGFEKVGTVVVSDGSDLHKIFEQQSRRNTRTRSTTLSVEDEEKDLQSAPATGVKDDAENHRKQISPLSIESGSQSSEDGTSEQLENEQAELLKNNKRRLTSVNPDPVENDRDSTNIGATQNGNYQFSDSKGNRAWTHESRTRDKTEVEIEENKLAQRAQETQGESDGLSKSEELNSRDSNLSKSTPPPFIKKVKNTPARAELDDIYFLFIVIGCSVAGIAGLALAGYCWYKLHTTAKAVSEAEYSGYGTSKQTLQAAQGDSKLDFSAEMYHYHQTKSQLSAMEKASGSKSRIKGETLEDDENSDEGDEEDYTVYECHGLAPTGDMTVVNPLFSDQEIVGSDQDANGERSGASGQGSPVAPRHASKD